MTKTSYYYESPENITCIDGEGAVCNWCGKLALIRPIGEFIEMPQTGLDDEYGREEGDIHMHPECAQKCLEIHIELVVKMNRAIKLYKG